MKHFLYAMKSADPAPAGSGKTLSWFRYYKWDADGEVFVPRKEPFLPIAAGDMLWFTMDDKVLGGVVVLRIEEEFSQGIQEIWYEADKIKKMPESSSLHFGETSDSTIHSENAEFWLEMIES